MHCHNDLGMAVANSLAGVQIGGARQVECTINGLGERAGNTSLEEIVMAVKTRKDYFGLELGLDTTQIVPASKLVSQITGFVVQPNKAVVGANAFAHASGIHQDGVLKARDTYEIMRAEDVGWSANKIVLGKLSGRNAFKQRLQELGIALDSEAELNTAFARFKELADRKAEIFDEDIIAIVTEESAEAQQKEHYRFLSLSQHSETGEQPHAKVVFSVEGKESHRRSARQRSGRRHAQRDRNRSGQRFGTAAVLGQRDHDRHAGAGRSHGAAVEERAHRQWRGHRSGYRRGVREGVYLGAQQAVFELRQAEPATLGVRRARRAAGVAA